MDKGKETERGKALAALVKSAREETGISQRACAAATGVQVSWLQRMELGQFDRPDASRMARLVGFLPIDPEKLLEISGDYIPNELPDPRAYLRTKFNATDEEISQFDEYVAQIERGRESRKAKPKARKAANKKVAKT